MKRVLLLALALGALAVPAQAQTSTRLRLQCQADGPTDYSTSARYETRSSRRKFDASFEAAPNLGFSVGQFLAVSVAGVKVGQMRLARDPASGDVFGDLEFDSLVAEGNPFPANFPAVRSGTVVRIGPLGCTLR